MALIPIPPTQLLSIDTFDIYDIKPLSIIAVMGSERKKITHDIFKYETTYLNDYKTYPGVRRTRPSCQKEPFEEKVIQPAEHIYQDNETFVKWRKGAYVPFNILWKPKEITNTNPHVPIHTPTVSPLIILIVS